MRRYVQGLFVLSLCAVAVTASCRRNQPSLVDRNQPPDTQLWYAPPDSTEYQYLVHLYWRGIDRDGTVVRYIWTVKDSLTSGEAGWNPADRLRDFQEGRIFKPWKDESGKGWPARTDSIFAFTAYKDVAGVGVRKNRQAFYVAAIDDNGVIDPTPAGVEFVATIGQLPEIRFTTYVDGAGRSYNPNATPPADTVGMFRPFQISYHGRTVNGLIRGYLYYSLSSSVVLPGSNVWTSDLSDTLRSFSNTGVDALPAGTFRFVARCIDDANAESPVDAGQFRRGVCQVVVNFDPDTRISEVYNTTFRPGGVVTTVPVNVTDALPDTVSFMSWINIRYNGWDDARDVKVASPTDPDRCMDFQIKYTRNSPNFPNGQFEDSGWLPRNGRHDSDPNAATDSNTVNIGSLDYRWFVGAIDENGKLDGTPATFRIYGNHSPTLDSASMRDHFNNPVNIAVIDTLTWNFYKGIGWPYTSQEDTFVAGTGTYVKRFGWTLSATGHDDKRDPPGSAVKAWRFFAYTNYNAATNTGTPHQLGRSGASWFPGTADNAMNDRMELTIRYVHEFGDDVFANPPAYFNNVVTLVLYGRDTADLSGEFAQFVYLKEVPVDLPPLEDCFTGFEKAATGIAAKRTINSFATGVLGRWTPPRVIQFYLKVVR